MKAIYPTLILLFSACSDYGIAQRSLADQYIQQPTSATDVLLIVDDSATMQRHQERLATHFGGIESWLSQAQVNYRIGVTSTSMTIPNPMRPDCDPSEAIVGGSLSMPWISPDDVDPQAAFSRAVSLGVCGNATEMPLMVASNAASALALRPEADLSIVIISDEDDRSPGPVHQYVQSLQSLRMKRDYVRISALAVLEPDNCIDLHPEASVAPRLKAAVSWTDGVLLDLCSSDLEMGIQDISMNSARLRRSFVLNDVPDPRTLKVSIDGLEEPCGGSTPKWWYDRVSGEPTILFLTPPAIGSVVSVEYNAGSGDPSLFCGGL